MATVAEARGDLKGALALHTRALTIKLRAEPAGRPSRSVADSHFNMAQLYARLGRAAEAREAAARSLALSRELAGPGHPDTLEAAALARQLGVPAAVVSGPGAGDGVGPSGRGVQPESDPAGGVFRLSSQPARARS